MNPTVGRIVHFYPPQACVTPDTEEHYAAIITAVGGDGRAADSIDLVTFGRDSIYFQHGVPFSETPTTAKRWAWPPRT